MRIEEKGRSFHESDLWLISILWLDKTEQAKLLKTKVYQTDEKFQLVAYGLYLITGMMIGVDIKVHMTWKFTLFFIIVFGRTLKIR